MVNSDDLADALEQGEIFGAGLDVITGEPNIGPDHRLVKAKNCTSCRPSCLPVLIPGVVIPHMGSADVDTRKKMAELCESRCTLYDSEIADIQVFGTALTEPRERHFWPRSSHKQCM